MADAEEITITNFGAGGVGKSCLTVQFVTNQWIGDEYDPTIEDCYTTRPNVDDKLVNLTILDTAGQEDYKAMADQWIKTGEGFLVVYDITKPDSLKELDGIFEKIGRHNVDSLDHVPMVIVGNKKDLADKRQVTMDQAREKVQLLLKKQMRDGDVEYFPPILETSAKTRENVETSFHYLVKEVRKKRDGKLRKDKATENESDGKKKKKKWKFNFRRLSIRRVPADK
eukprot:gb/GECH01013937.1/.p1 GENE.gb/GECH01013937.1/~~gb/GECH01013937.1/.p1  ORF type:complete len:226 (+),score=48.82 gb/GECH01013937.1/:1-678(+)